MKKTRKSHKALKRISACLITAAVAVSSVFMHFGGFDTGKAADISEFSAYAEDISAINIPANVRIVALGEATHGNSEFQQLKLDVFRQMVEQYNVRAFVLEGDCGGCEQANRYIHGGEGTAAQAAAAIGFEIYRTDEMAALLDYMREYNSTAENGEDLRFYGCDMQRYSYNVKFLEEQCDALGVDSTELKKLVNGDTWSTEFDSTQRKSIISDIKERLSDKDGSEQGVHFADILLQYFALEETFSKNGTYGDYGSVRNGFMADNVQWIDEQEHDRGFDRIFVAGHNGHIAKWLSADDMGSILAERYGDKYYAIGTEFYKTTCNLPITIGKKQLRATHTLYSHDPLAVAAKQAGKDICLLDFAKLPENSSLYKTANEYIWQGSVGEMFTLYMRAIPMSYRIYQQPAQLYDSMIFVTDATPTAIHSEEG